MSGGIDIALQYGVEDAHRRKRQQEAAVLAQSLLEKGAEPDAVNQITQNYIQTGNPTIPTMATKTLPPDENSPDGRSTRVPFTLDTKKKGLFGFDTSTGQFTQEETPEGMTDFDVKSYASQPKPTAPKTQGYTIYVNSQDGTEIRREKNNNGKDEVIRIAPPRPSSTPKNPEDALALDTMKKYQAAILRGDEIPDEFMDSVRSAADHLNLDMTEVQKDPGMLDSLINSVSSAAPGAVSPAKPKFRGTSPRFSPKAGRPLSKDKAQEFMQQAGGDKNKARKLATQAGYTF